MSSRSSMSCSNAFFVASSALSFLVIPEWLGMHISLTFPFSCSSSSFIRLVFGFFVHLVPSSCHHCAEGVRDNRSSSFAFRYIHCFDNGFLFGTKYRCLESHSVFYRSFGSDYGVTDSLILQGSIREYLQPFVFLELSCSVLSFP
jgi:hypothetical protein